MRFFIFSMGFSFVAVRRFFYSILLTIFLVSHSTKGTELPEFTSVSEIRGYFKREHSLIKPYQGSGMTVPYWDFTGTTMVTNQYVRLTPNQQSRLGGLWNSVPVKSRDWELIITFNVHGTTGDLYGDGMAIWYTKERNQVGDVFGGKDHFTGMGIFLDTYSNHNGPHNHAHPYVSAMVNNGTMHYDHDRDGTHTQLGGKGCTSRFRNKDYETNLLIRYVDDTIAVYTDVENKQQWQLCFSVPAVRLPTGYFFGASAATGELSDNHDIIAVKMYEIEFTRTEKQGETDRDTIVPQAQFYSAPRDHIEDPPPSRLGGMKTGLLVAVALIGVAICLIVGVVILQKRQETSRKRFY